MLVSQKCQYALRAVFELAKHYGDEPMNIAQVAEAQAIPPRFLEVILGQLKQAGFVESRRGAEGGYLLVQPPSSITVGDVIRFVQGPIGPVSCVVENSDDRCPLLGKCVFMSMWKRVQTAMTDIYDHTTLQDLVDEQARLSGTYVASYVI